MPVTPVLEEWREGLSLGFIDKLAIDKWQATSSVRGPALKNKGGTTE